MTDETLIDAAPAPDPAPEAPVEMVCVAKLDSRARYWGKEMIAKAAVPEGAVIVNLATDLPEDGSYRWSHEQQFFAPVARERQPEIDYPAEAVNAIAFGLVAIMESPLYAANGGPIRFPPLTEKWLAWWKTSFDAKSWLAATNPTEA